VCCSEQSKYAREIKIRRNARAVHQVTALPTVAEATQPAQGGVAAAVAREIELVAPERRNSALASIALALARGLDVVGLGSSHPGLARELRIVLGELHSGTHTVGKLAAVVALTDRSSPSTPEPPA
jgi:hypothetical protein